MSTEMQDLLIEEHSIVGVRATGVHGGVEIRATLTVAADGRDSRLRRKAELVPIDTGVPIDVLWFHLPEPQDPPPGPASSGSAMPPTRCQPSSTWAFAHRNLTRVMRASGDRLVPRPVVRGLQVLEPLVQRALARLIGHGFLPERPDLGGGASTGGAGDR